MRVKGQVPCLKSHIWGGVIANLLGNNSTDEIICFWSYFQEHHEEDFFLYIAYSDESVYGA
jgi:hypothetical protein